MLILSTSFCSSVASTTPHTSVTKRIARILALATEPILLKAAGLTATECLLLYPAMLMMAILSPAGNVAKAPWNMPMATATRVNGRPTSPMVRAGWNTSNMAMSTPESSKRENDLARGRWSLSMQMRKITSATYAGRVRLMRSSCLVGISARAKSVRGRCRTMTVRSVGKWSSKW